MRIVTGPAAPWSSAAATEVGGCSSGEAKLLISDLAVERCCKVSDPALTRSRTCHWPVGRELAPCDAAPRLHYPRLGYGHGAELPARPARGQPAATASPARAHCTLAQWPVVRRPCPTHGDMYRSVVRPSPPRNLRGTGCGGGGHHDALSLRPTMPCLPRHRDNMRGRLHKP